jgi:hypothetical protein
LMRSIWLWWPRPNFSAIQNVGFIFSWMLKEVRLPARMRNYAFSIWFLRNYEILKYKFSNKYTPVSNRFQISLILLKYNQYEYLHFFELNAG